MFNEKNLSRLIILTPILTIIILVALVLYSFIQIKHDSFLQGSIQLEKIYMARQEAVLQKQVNDVFQYIRYQKDLMLKNEKKEIEQQMKAFLKVILNYKATPEKYETYIKENSKHDTDFIIYDTKNNTIIKNRYLHIKEEMIQEMVHRYKNMDGAFILQGETNLFFFRNIPSEHILIILEKDMYFKLADLKDSIVKWIENIRFERSNYLWISSSKTNELIANPYKKYETAKDGMGKDGTHQKAINNTFFVQKLVNLSAKNPDYGFFEFYTYDMEQETKRKKLGYTRLYEEWDWIIGCGVDINEIQENIKNTKLLMEKEINRYVKTTILIAILLILVISLLSILTSYKINRTFKAYQVKVKKEEQKLKYLNKNLKNQIEIALEEAKEKDRAMLHQSRLARMGNILNMIAHQWRQPLTQLAGIMMELETTVMFKKADDKFLYACASDATKIIQFMSLTIDDFRNFFKPARDKENFSVAQACKDAISLIKDTLISEHITLNFHIIDDKNINGYKREYSQVILNLLLNAKDAIIMNNIKDGKIILIVKTQGSFSIVKVEDNAGGIEKDNLELIFEPYFSTKKSQGTGLGLYMSKMIIEKNMQGHLSVKNGKNGAIFTIFI